MTHALLVAADDLPVHRASVPAVWRGLYTTVLNERIYKHFLGNTSLTFNTLINAVSNLPDNLGVCQ